MGDVIGKIHKEKFESNEDAVKGILNALLGEHAGGMGLEFGKVSVICPPDGSRFMAFHVSTTVLNSENSVGYSLSYWVAESTCGTRVVLITFLLNV